MPFKSSRQRKGFFAQIKGIRSQIERAQEKRILSKTKQEEMKLAKEEKKLSKRLEFEMAKEKRLSRLAEEKIALEKVKSKERDAQAELDKYTLGGKIKGRVKLGAQRFAEEQKRRQEFARTPEGRRRAKESADKRKKFFKKFGSIKWV